VQLANLAFIIKQKEFLFSLYRLSSFEPRAQRVVFEIQKSKLLMQLRFLYVKSNQILYLPAWLMTELEIIILHISDVPSAIVSIWASLKQRSTSKSEDRPFAPWIWRALLHISHASSVLISFAAATSVAA
jgi:hypothetical protein